MFKQKKKKQVVITSGHRCPEHNRYNDPLPKNQYSKHMIGAEVSFYVKGLEKNPEEVVVLLQEYFKQNPDYQKLPEYQEFKRWEKLDSDISNARARSLGGNGARHAGRNDERSK